jgi:hypothetical protein
MSFHLRLLSFVYSRWCGSCLPSSSSFDLCFIKKGGSSFSFGSIFSCFSFVQSWRCDDMDTRFGRLRFLLCLFLEVLFSLLCGFLVYT